MADAGGAGRQQTHGTLQNMTNNQAFFMGDLISERPEQLQGVANRLHGKDDFSIWAWNVKRILTAAEYVQLIDKSVPRPNRNSLNYRRWQDASMQVSLWLTSQITEDVQRRLEHSPMSIEYADDTFKAIQKVIFGQGVMQASVAAVKLANLKRADFATAKDFITQYRHAIDTCQYLDIEIGPLYSALVFLSNIRADMPNWVDNSEHALTDDKVKNYQWTDFQELAYEAYIRADTDTRVESFSAAPKQPRNGGNRGGSKREQQHQRMRRFHPNGKKTPNVLLLKPKPIFIPPKYTPSSVVTAPIQMSARRTLVKTVQLSSRQIPLQPSFQSIPKTCYCGLISHISRYKQ